MKVKVFLVTYKGHKRLNPTLTSIFNSDMTCLIQYKWLFESLSCSNDQTNVYFFNTCKQCYYMNISTCNVSIENCNYSITTESSRSSQRPISTAVS